MNELKVRSGRELTIGLLSAAGVVVLFSSFVLVSRHGMQNSLRASDLAFLRFLVSAVLLFPVLFFAPPRRLVSLTSFVMALTGGFGFALFAYVGFDRAPASHGSTLIHGTLPATALLVGWLVGRERTRRAQWWGALVTLAGITLMLWDTARVASSRQLVGDASLLAASICWGTYGFMVKRSGFSIFQAAAVVAAISWLTYIPIYAWAGWERLLTAPAREVLEQAIFQGFLIGVVSLILYTRTVAALGPNAAASAAALVPIITTITAIPVLGEVPSAQVWIGVVVAFVGIVLPIVAAPRR